MIWQCGIDNFYTGMVGGNTALNRLHTPFITTSGDTFPYAHGLFLDEYNGLRTVGHGGADAGYRSYFLRFPDQQFSLIVLCNIATTKPGDLAQDVADIYLKDALQRTKSIATELDGIDPATRLSPEELKEFAGVYASVNRNRIFLLRFEEDTLMLEIGPGFPVLQVDENHFEIADMQLRLKFAASTDTHPATLWVPHRVGSQTDKFVCKKWWSPSNEELQSFTGTYYSDELGTQYRFSFEDSTLVFHHRKLASHALKPTFKDVFLLDTKSIFFMRNNSDEITGFRISSRRVWNVRFDRE